jgi:hypothetical protein
MTFRDELVLQTGQVDVNCGAVSQSDLADRLAALDQEAEAQVRNAQSFWNSGFWAFPTEFREGEEFTVDCVLERDKGEYLSARNGRKPEAPSYVVPVPRKLWPLLRSDPLLHLLMIAPDHLYDEHAGYRLPEVPDGQ